MDGLLDHTGFAALVAGAPAVRGFTLVDVGCGSGLDPAWRSFGAKLSAFEADAPEFYPARNFAAARPGLTAAPDPRTAELEREITALRHSSSWRLTAPLRAAMRLLRGRP